MDILKHGIISPVFSQTQLRFIILAEHLAPAHRHFKIYRYLMRRGTVEFSISTTRVFLSVTLLASLSRQYLRIRKIHLSGRFQQRVYFLIFSQFVINLKV